MSEVKEYTLTVFTENLTGLMGRVVSIFARRHINIESLTVSKSSMPDIHRFTIVVNVTQAMVEKLTAQLEKQVDILKAFYYETDEIVHQEIALYKVPAQHFMQGHKMEQLVRKHNARILEIEPEYIVIEKTGHPDETESLLNELRGMGIYEFVRSGRIAITRPMERLNKYLESLELEAQSLD
jgi:acetolactate synthase-1/3 small subunit